MATSTIKADRPRQINIRGSHATFGRVDGDVSIYVHLPDIKSSQCSLSKTSNIAASIYGSISATGCTLTLNYASIAVNVIFLKFTPSITMSTFTELAKIYILTIDEDLIVTLS